MKAKCFVALLLFVSTSLFAQSGGVAGISGVVKDPSGAVIPNANVVISRESQGVIRTITSNSEGVFTAPVLIPGSGYEVKVTASGFADYDAKDIVLQVGENMDLHINLTVGQTATTIDVNATAPMIEDTKTDVSTVVDTAEINSLPINGRRVDNFVLLTPGVTNDATFGLLTFRGIAGNNSFLLDGNDNTEQFYDENAGRTRIVSQVSADAVQEFQVVSADYSAEYGKAMGGVVNTVTKSGGNQIHGSAFFYYRNTWMDARDYFATFNPPDRQDQVGGTVGGAIVKNKLFYFVDVDITRRNFPFADSTTNAGFLDPLNKVWLTCGAPATTAQCSAINGLLPRFFGSIPRQAKNDLYFARLDYHLNDKNTLSASFNFLRWRSPNGIQTGTSSTSGAGITGNGDDFVTVRNGKFSETFVPTSSFVNEFQFGWNTDRQADNFDNAELGGGLGYLDVSVAGTQLGPATYLPRVEPSEQRFQFMDHATLTKGTHTVKFGADIASTEDYTSYLSNLFGSYTYQTVTQFAEDYSGSTTGKDWQSYSQAFGNRIVDTTIKEYGLYIQDSWRASNRLTVQYGVRWEYSHVQQPTIFNPDWPLTGIIHTPKSNFAPRLGATYRLNDKTVLSAGYGMYYARFLGSLTDNLFASNGIYTVSDSLSASNPAQLAAGPTFPNALAAPPTGASVSASTVQFAAPNLKTPYSQQGNFTIQREISTDLSINASYIWSRTAQLYGVVDVNAPAQICCLTYTVNNLSGTPASTFTMPYYAGARPNTKYGAAYEDTNGVDAYYNALSITATKRMSHGLSALASYTYAHEIDDGQGAGTNALYFSGSNWTYNGNFRNDQGSGYLDQRHRFVLSWIWSPTFTHRTGAFYKYVVNNWQLGTITSLASGRPDGGSLSVKVLSTGVPTVNGIGALSTSYLDGFPGSSRPPFLPVDSLYVPPHYQADARLSKILPFGEAHPVTIYLNLEAFNLSNTISATALSFQAYTATKLVLTPTPTAMGVPNADGGFPDGTEARRLQLSVRIMF
jgi:hypothetical protein